MFPIHQPAFPLTSVSKVFGHDSSRDSGANLDSPAAVAEWVADTLRDRIVKGDLTPNARIVERKLSAELSVSRTPVREALKLLQAEGLVEIARNRGAQVKPYTAQEARELFDVISVLESLAAERLAQRITPSQLNRLEELHGIMLAYYKTRNTDAYFDANTAVHEAVLQGCGNPVVAQTHGRLMSRARRGRYMAIMDPDRWQQAVDEHESLMAALRIGDAAAAAMVWRTHLAHTGETVALVLGQAASG